MKTLAEALEFYTTCHCRVIFTKLGYNTYKIEMHREEEEGKKFHTFAESCLPDHHFNDQDIINCLEWLYNKIEEEESKL